MTLENSISGGEKYNIVDGRNGIICKEDIDSIVASLEKVCNNTDYARQLGKNAYNYYSDKCTIENMADGFIQAIESEI